MTERQLWVVFPVSFNSLDAFLWRFVAVPWRELVPEQGIVMKTNGIHVWRWCGEPSWRDSCVNFKLGKFEPKGKTNPRLSVTHWHGRRREAVMGVAGRATDYRETWKRGKWARAAAQHQVCHGRNSNGNRDDAPTVVLAC
jgi:hypothetical protein